MHAKNTHVWLMQVVWLQCMFALLKAYHVEQQYGDFDGLAPDFRICTSTGTAHKFHQGFQLEPPPSIADPKLAYEGFPKAAILPQQAAKHLGCQQDQKIRPACLPCTLLAFGPATELCLSWSPWCVCCCLRACLARLAE